MYGRHNELRDFNCSLLELAGMKQIVSEPTLNTKDDVPLRADWAVKGFWEAFLDCCIINAESDSLKNLPLKTVFQQRKNKKLETYSETAKARRASFHPIPANFSKKWNSCYSHVVGFIRARMRICRLKAVNLCLRERVIE